MDRKVISSNTDNIHCIGSSYPGGTYCLQISLEKSIDLIFGRFKGGKVISLKKGKYLYIGSALAIQGSTTLGNRLRRHSSRSEGKQAHRIQIPLLNFFDEIGISYTSKPSSKKLFWNIDHMLDLPFAEIIGIIFIRDPKLLENSWSKFLENLSETVVFEKGLGANDSLGHTHIQYSQISDGQWELLPFELPM